MQTLLDVILPVFLVIGFGYVAVWRGLFPVSGIDGERSFTSLGVIGKMEELARSYLDSVDGILTQREKALTTQVELQESRIEEFTERLELKRAQLQAQFTAMETALAELQSQQSSLSQLAQLG